MKKVLSFALLLILALACRKTDTCDGQYAEMDAEYLKYWYFPEKTYWVYQAKDTDLVDTVKVIRTITENKDFNDDQKASQQPVCNVSYFNSLHHSYYNKPDEREEFFAAGSNYNNKPVLTYRTKMKKNFPIYLYYENAVKKDSLKVNGFNYQKVLMFNDPQPVIFAKGVGIISILAEDSILWELKEYKIGG